MKKKKIIICLILSAILFFYLSIKKAAYSWMPDLKANIFAAGQLINGKELYVIKPFIGGYTYLPAVSILYRFNNSIIPAGVALT